MASEKSKLIARAVRGQSVFVYAASSKDPVLTAASAFSELNKKVTSAFECSDCGNHMHVVASASPEPYCVLCGSDRVIESNRKIPETAAFVNDTELSSVSCAACDTENVMPTSAITASGNSVHCVLCGSGLKVVSETINDEEPEKADFAGPSPEDDHVGGSEDVFPDLADSEDVEEASGDSEDEASGDSEDEAPGEFTEGEDFNEDQPPVAGVGFMEDEQHVISDLNDVPDFSGLSGEDSGNEEELFLDAYDGAQTVGSGEPLVDALELNDTPDSLTFVSKAQALLAMKGAHVVAFATPQSAGKHADILHTPEYAQAISITAGKTGMRKALAKFGFRNITVKPVDTAAVNKGIAVAKSKFATAQASKDAVFADSIAIAAAGLGRGLWRDAPNPIKAAIASQLSSSMSPQAANLAASRIMVASGMEYSKVLVSYANKLAAMTVVARKEFADMLDLVADDVTPSEEVSDAEDLDTLEDTVADLDDVTSRFSATAALLKAPARKKVSSSVQAAAVLSGKAPLSFGY